MNVPKLHKLIHRLKSLPRPSRGMSPMAGFCQRDPISKNLYGCIAGEAIMMEGGNLLPDGEQVYGANENQSGYTLFQQAGEILDIPKDKWISIFHTDDWPEPIREKYIKAVWFLRVNIPKVLTFIW